MRAERLLPRAIGGRFAAPPSKSEAQRALLCAALADAPTHLVCPELSRDVAVMADGLRALSAAVGRTPDGFFVTPLTCAAARAALDCGDSGAALRFLLPLAAALGVRAELWRSARLAKRPVAPLAEVLRTHGCKITEQADGSIVCAGQLRGDRYTISGAVSSQFVSGLLLALPLLGAPVELRLLPPVVSADYITLTRQVQERFGVRWEAGEQKFFLPAGQGYRAPGAPFCVSGDWSGAAFWLCAGAISQPVTVTGLEPASAQPDRRVLELLRRFGARVTVEDTEISVAPGELHGITAALDDCPDLLPPLAAVAAAAAGTTRFTGVGRLRWKESDRPAVLAALLNRLGGYASVEGDSLVIQGGKPLCGGTADACGDHRIAMAAALLACRCTAPLALSGAACVEKSYPGFWAQLEGEK